MILWHYAQEDIHGSSLCIIIMIKINTRAPITASTWFSDTIILSYYLHLKIYLLSNRLRNVAVIRLDIHIICKYTFLYSQLNKGSFLYGFEWNRHGPFCRQRPVRGTSCVQYTYTRWHIIIIFSTKNSTSNTPKIDAIKTCLFFLFFSLFLMSDMTLTSQTQIRVSFVLA